MDCSVSETLARLLLRLSEAGEPAVLWGRQAAPFFGREFERLLDRGVLTELAQAEEWDVCPACDCGLDARPIQTINGGAVAVCPFDHRNDRALETSDLQSFRIDPAALVREIVKASGFTNGPSEILPSLWHLGQMTGRRELLLAITRAAAQQPGLIAKIRLLFPSAQVTMIAPGLSVSELAGLAEAGIQVVRTEEYLGSTSDGGFAVGLALLEQSRNVSPRLIVQRAAKTVSLDGHPKTLPDQAFQLLLLLAEHAKNSSSIIENRAIEARLWGSNIHKISSQVREPVRALRDALATGSSDSEAVRALIENRRKPNGYRLVLAPEEIELAP